jgi:hypothetical protein
MKVQYGGTHYKDYAIQPWEIWEAYKMDAFEGSVLKYLLRYKDKGKPIEDLYKCRHNLEYLIAREERKANVRNQIQKGQSAQSTQGSNVQDLRHGTNRLEEIRAYQSEVEAGTASYGGSS